MEAGDQGTGGSVGSNEALDLPDTGASVAGVGGPQPLNKKMLV